MINGVVNSIGESSSHLYADDLCIYLGGEPGQIIKTINTINGEIEKINEWMVSHGMQLNVSKTQPIIIGSKHIINKLSGVRDTLPRIEMNGTEVDFMDSVRYLGFIFNSCCTSEDHVKSIVKKVNMPLARVKHQLTRAIILPLFDYAAMMYHGFDIHGTGEDVDRLNVLMNSCVRFICNLTGRDHVSNRYIELNLLNAYNRRVMLICCFIYNYVITGKPMYLNDIFKINTNNTRAGKDVVSLVVKNVGRSRNKLLFAHCACKLWNSIPLDIRISGLKNIFFNNIKSYLMKMQAENNQ